MGWKLIGYGIKDYLRDSMNIFDGFIVIISLVLIYFFFTHSLPEKEKGICLYLSYLYYIILYYTKYFFLF